MEWKRQAEVEILNGEILQMGVFQQVLNPISSKNKGRKKNNALDFWVKKKDKKASVIGKFYTVRFSV